MNTNQNYQQSPKDYEIDQNVGFTIIEAHEIDDIGMSGIIEKVRSVVGDTPTYLSIDIDGKTAFSPFKAHQKLIYSISSRSEHCPCDRNSRIGWLDHS